MSDKRPSVDWTLCWDVVFVIDGKTEELCLMTDDFEEVYGEYLALKKKHKSVVFLKHNIHTKGKMVFSQEMFGVPVEAPQPILNAEDPMTPQRVRNAINRGEMVQEPAWMGKHNRYIAARMLKEPPQDRV